MVTTSEEEEESSEESGERMKNIRSVLVKSPESKSELDDGSRFVFKRKLGDLIFDANFEAGNLGLVEQMNEFTYDLMIRPDVANPRFRLWFNFTISNQRPGQCVILSIVNLSEYMNLFNLGLTPVVRSRMYPNWLRLNQDQVFYHRSSHHNNRRVLSIAFRFEQTSFTNKNEHQFALFYPYTPTNLTQFINRWNVELKRRQRQQMSKRGTQKHSISRPVSVTMPSESDHYGQRKSSPRAQSSLGFSINSSRISRASQETMANKQEASAVLRAETLSESILSKPIHKIGMLNSGDDPTKKPQVILVGGWSGNVESASYYVCQGLLDFMLSEDPVARAACSCLNLTAFPMPDPDSLWAGNSRSDIFGQTNSLKRQVIEANLRIYQNLHRIRASVNEIFSSSEEVYMIEMIVNINLIGSRIIGTNFGDTFRMERHLRLPRHLSRFVDGFYMEKCRFINETEQKTKSRLIDMDLKDHVEYYRLEISPYAYHRRTLSEGDFIVYDQEKYLLLGKAICYALLELARASESRKIDPKVEYILDSFQPKAYDVDDLILRSNSSPNNQH